MKKMTSLQKVSLATLMSSSVEWYCFLLYGLAAGTVFSKIFYPPDTDPYTAQILAYLTFAIGYLARPFGAMFFGYYGDKIGRKFTVIASLCLMGGATFAIAFIPDYSQIGIWAPISLLVLRLFQCFGLGGKWGGGILMTFENADPKERAFYASIPQLGLPVGLFLASLIMGVMTYHLPEQEFLKWGWRIAFGVSASLIVIIMYIRLHIMETKDFMDAQDKAKEMEQEEKSKSLPLVEVFRRYPLSILYGIGTRWVDGTFYNVFAVFMVSYCVQELGVSEYHMFLVNIAFALASMPFILFFGKVADKIGKAKTFTYASLACAAFTFPGLYAIQGSGGNPFVIAIVLILGWSIIYSGLWGVLGSLWAQLFEPEIRYTGISFVYHAPSFFVAGIVPGLSTYLLKLGGGDIIYVAIFTTAVSLFSAWCAYQLKVRHDKYEKSNKEGHPSF